MDKNSTHNQEFKEELASLTQQIPKRYASILTEFCISYRGAARSLDEADINLVFFLKLLRKQFESPYTFEPYHQKVRTPIDYYRFGVEFIRPIVDLPHSKILGLEHLETIRHALKKKENVILLANHQIEADPQAIAILLETAAPEMADSIIYVAGERVVTDPLAIPFSMGCDLLCIYSKRYIDHPPEEKASKQLHNKKTMELMSRLLVEGGKIIFIAPSGGRDRRNTEGHIEVAPFDPSSIEMCHLMAKRAKKTTHFIPFALSTYDLLPPPDTIQRELGETRNLTRTPIHIAFEKPFDMEHFPGSDSKAKEERRNARAKAIWTIVNKNHSRLLKTL